jgi:hypothetical protein
VAEREEERARLPMAAPHLEANGALTPEEVRSLRAAAVQILKEHIDGAPLIFPLLRGGGGSGDELSPRCGFGSEFGRGGEIGRGAGGGSGGAARGDTLQHCGSGRRRSARRADVVGTLGGERVSRSAGGRGTTSGIQECGIFLGAPESIVGGGSDNSNVRRTWMEKIKSVFFAYMHDQRRVMDLSGTT